MNQQNNRTEKAVDRRPGEMFDCRMLEVEQRRKEREGRSPES